MSSAGMGRSVTFTKINYFKKRKMVEILTISNDATGKRDSGVHETLHLIKNMPEACKNRLYC